MVDTIFVLVTASCYPQRIAPAAARFEARQDTTTLIRLLKEGRQRSKPQVDAMEDLQPFIDILEGREFYGPSTNHKPPFAGVRTSTADLAKLVTEQVYSALYDSLCIADQPNLPARQVLSRGMLLPYLYRHSEYLERVFTGGVLRGQTLQLLPTREVLDKKDLAKILEHLNRVPAPNDAVEQKEAEKKLRALHGPVVSSEFAALIGPPVSVQFNQLKLLLQRALARNDLAIVQQFE